MVKTNSHRFNTHVKHLSLSASVVIIIITRLLATSRIITQYLGLELAIDPPPPQGGILYTMIF